MTQNHSCLAPLLPRRPGSEDALLEAHSRGTGKVHSSWCTWSGSHGCTFKHMFSNPHNKPEWTIRKLLCNRSINGNHLWKVCPFGEPLFYNSSAHSHHPISWAVPWTLDCGASCSHGPPVGAQGGCVFREQFVLWNRFRLPGWLYLLRMVIIRTEKHLLLILKHPMSYEVGVKSASSH